MNQVLEICHCGNDRASHHEGKHACLALACDCKAYVDRWDPKPAPPPKPYKVKLDSEPPSYGYGFSHWPYP